MFLYWVTHMLSWQMSPLSIKSLKNERSSDRKTLKKLSNLKLTTCSLVTFRTLQCSRSNWKSYDDYFTSKKMIEGIWFMVALVLWRDSLETSAFMGRNLIKLGLLSPAITNHQDFGVVILIWEWISKQEWIETRKLNNTHHDNNFSHKQFTELLVFL